MTWYHITGTLLAKEYARGPIHRVQAEAWVVARSLDAAAEYVCMQCIRIGYEYGGWAKGYPTIQEVAQLPPHFMQRRLL